MDVREIPPKIFNNLIKEPIIKNQRDYAEDLGYRDPKDYKDELIVVGELEELAVLRQGLTSFCTYISVHTDLDSALLAQSQFDSAFCLMAGTRDTGSWSYGRGSQVRSDVWTWNSDNQYYGRNGLVQFEAISKASGIITLKTIELLETGNFDTSSFGSLELDI